MGTTNAEDLETRQLHSRSDRWRELLIGIGVAALLTVAFVMVNWYWLQVNVVTYGWDRMDHLITTLVLNNMFSAPGPTTAYDALAYASYYPPLVHYASAFLYQLFGVSEEIAVMANCLFLFVLLLATWSIGRRLANRSTATLAALFLGLFPMIFAMSRYLYLDLALTALVAASVAFLLASERFSRRGPALWFGAAIGASFLVKWTTAAFLIGPLTYIVWRSGIVPYLFRNPRCLLPNWWRLGAALAAAAVINLAWLFPAREAVSANPVGWWLLPAFTGLLGGVLYALFAAQRDGKDVTQAFNNALSAAVIGAWLIALWYLTNTEFIDNFVYTAYGREGGTFMAYDKYFREVTTEQLGLFFTGVFCVVVLVWLVQRRHVLRQTFAGLSDTSWVLAIWAIVPIIIFSTRVSLAHSRFVMPFLPPFAIWIAAGLVSWRPRAVRWTAIGLVLALAFAQYAMISFEEFSGWRRRFTVQVAGQPVDLLANGFFIQYPASGVTDADFAIAGDVLSMVDDERKAKGRELIDLGLLVNSYQLHEKHFLYEIYMRYPQVRLRELARNWREQAAYNQLFEMDYILVSDTHSYRTHESSQEVVERILSKEEDLFNLAFQPVQTWTFPTGEQLSLYQRRHEATEPGLAAEDYHLLLEQLIDPYAEDDALILAAPDQAYMTGLLLPADSTVTVTPLPAEETGSDDVRAKLAGLAASNTRLFLIRHNIDQVDPTGQIERWLNENLIAGSDVWLNSLRVTPFIKPGNAEEVEQPVDGTWLGGPRLERAVFRATTTAADEITQGGAIVVDLLWQADEGVPRKASLQLLSRDGTLLAQNDQDVRSDNDVGQQFVLLIPTTATPGDYLLTVAIYDPESGERFVTDAGDDRLTIATLPLH